MSNDLIPKSSNSFASVGKLFPENSRIRKAIAYSSTGSAVYGELKNARNYVRGKDAARLRSLAATFDGHLNRDKTFTGPEVASMLRPEAAT